MWPGVGEQRWVTVWSSCNRQRRATTGGAGQGRVRSVRFVEQWRKADDMYEDDSVQEAVRTIPGRDYFRLN